MSLFSLYSILDVKGHAYGPIMSFLNDATATRAFQEMVISRDNNSLIALYPSDYSLYSVGTFDNETGKLFGSSVPELVCTGLEAHTAAVAEVRRRRELRNQLEGDVPSDIETPDPVQVS